MRDYEIKGLSFRVFVDGIVAHEVTDAFRARTHTDLPAKLPELLAPALRVRSVVTGVNE